MLISVVNFNSLVRSLELGRWKDDLCLFLSLQSTPLYVVWNWANRKDDLCLFLSLPSTSLYAVWNWVSRKDDLCFYSS